MADLYSNITKPVLDMVIYVRRLSDKVSRPTTPGPLRAIRRLSACLQSEAVTPFRRS